MPNLAVTFGLILVVIGASGYLGTGRQSVTALIPAFIGIVLAALGFLARAPGVRKHAMHGAAALGLLGIAGSLGRIVSTLVKGEPVDWSATPVLLQILTAVVLLVFVSLCVRSFVAARRADGSAASERPR